MLTHENTNKPMIVGIDIGHTLCDIRPLEISKQAHGTHQPFDGF